MLNFRILNCHLSCAIILVGFLACAKSGPTEPVSPDVMIGRIDPDQKALPKEAPVDVASTPVTDVTLDGKGETIAPGLEANAVAPTPTATPTVEQLTNHESSATTLGLSPALTAEASSPGSKVAAESGRRIGSGGQTRFVKASELNIRSQPNRFSKIVGQLVGGDEVHVTMHGAWAKLEDGRWIRSRWLVKKPTSKFVRSFDEGDDAPRRRKVKKSPRGSTKKKRKKT